MSMDSFGRFSNPALLILISLAGGDKHGYAMMDDIEAISGTRPGPGTLYGAISRLEDSGFIEGLDSDDRRRPYRITEAGMAALRGQLEDMRKISIMGINRLDGFV